VEFMRLFGRDLHYENPKLDDIRPFWHEVNRWLRSSS
jgi:hypothetical protein